MALRSQRAAALYLQASPDQHIVDWLLANFPGATPINTEQLNSVLMLLFQTNNTAIKLEEENEYLEVTIAIIVVTYPITTTLTSLLLSVEAALNTLKNRLTWDVEYAIRQENGFNILLGNSRDIHVRGTLVPPLITTHTVGWKVIAPLTEDKTNVFLASRSGDSAVYVGKVIEYKDLHTFNQVNEIQVHLAKNNIAPQLIEVRSYQGNIGVTIAEKMEGTLEDILAAAPSPETRTRIATDIRALIKKMHELDIFHRDFHPQNITYNRVGARNESISTSKDVQYEFKLIDFDGAFYISKENALSILGDVPGVIDIWRDRGPTDNAYANYIDSNYSIIKDYIL